MGDILYCPKCNSRRYSVTTYDAKTKLFHMTCEDCRYTEKKEWVYNDPNKRRK